MDRQSMIRAGVKHAGDFVSRDKPLAVLDAGRRRFDTLERVFADQLPPRIAMKERTGDL